MVNMKHHKTTNNHKPSRGIRADLLKIADNYEALEIEFKRVSQQLEYSKAREKKINRSYKASVGWTTKYRAALIEANKRLKEAGLEEIRVITHTEDEDDYEKQIKFDI